MGFWNAAVLVNEIRRQGKTVLPVNIHLSQAGCSIEEAGIRLGVKLREKFEGGSNRQNHRNAQRGLV